MIPGIVGQGSSAGGGGGSVPWTPAEISTGLWFKADDSGTITESGGAVSQWDDKSGNARHLAQGTGANQPTLVGSSLNGKAIVRFDGSNDRLIGESNLTGLLQNVGGAASFIVRRLPSVPATAEILGAVSTNTNTNGRIHTEVGRVASKPGLLARRLDADSAVSLQGTTDATTSAQIDEMLIDYANGDGWVYVDGNLDASSSSLTSNGNTSNTAPARIALGSNLAQNNFVQVDIAEWIVLDSLPSTDIRQRIEGYLAWEWGLEGSLDAGHPYKSAAPTV